MELSEFEDDDLEDEETYGPRRTDVDALRILAGWIAGHNGRDPSTGAIVDRDFVVVDVPTMSMHRV
ncbi:MAG: hypothetical protein H0T42_03155 [Deltaproteobacteria bacterium]|nr:hypothetical protein [Deltaproteobacteria bacterium]